MPPRRKTLAEHEASGAIAKNPGRFVGRTDPPAPKGPIGKAPRHLTDAEQAVWRELVNQAPDGVLTSYDRLSLEITVRMVLLMRAGKLTKQSELVSLFTTLGKYGFNPDGRGRLDIPEPKKPDEEDDLSELDD